MTDLQALIDRMAIQAQRKRSGEQMTLGGLISALEAMPDGAMVENLTMPHSYRGYYCDLAFERRPGTRPAKDLLDECRSSMGRTFEGYKGGDYDMGARTPLWVADYGRCGDRLMAVLPGGDLVTEPDEG